MTFVKFPKKLFFIALIVAPIFISCKNEKTDLDEKVPETPQELTVEQKKQALQNVAPATTNTTSAPTAGGINPAHGQPGHRCDIPVGAPLNGASGNTAPVRTVTPVSQSSSTNGINPPHGQPGHRCDIKVGDPL